jgi:hypothetical protein
MSYLVERYVPGRSVEKIREAIVRLETVAEQMAEGSPSDISGPPSSRRADRSVRRRKE